MVTKINSREVIHPEIQGLKLTDKTMRPRYVTAAERREAIENREVAFGTDLKILFPKNSHNP